MKKIIGITAHMDDGRHTISRDNIWAISDSGGVPVVLPNVTDEVVIDHYVQMIDGLYVTGGGDIDPTLFGEEPHPNLGTITPERDAFELQLLRKCLKADIPILAVCRGCQIVNIAAGGDMFQDIYGQIPKQLLQHQQRGPRSHPSHYVHVSKNSLLHSIVGSQFIKVNSLHHQAVREMGEGFKVCGTASDGIIEAFESEDHRFVVAVQWHPENMFGAGDTCSVRLFKAFIDACN